MNVTIDDSNSNKTFEIIYTTNENDINGKAYKIFKEV